MRVDWDCVCGSVSVGGHPDSGLGVGVGVGAVMDGTSAIATIPPSDYTPRSLPGLVHSHSRLRVQARARARVSSYPNEMIDVQVSVGIVVSNPTNPRT